MSCSVIRVFFGAVADKQEAVARGNLGRDRVDEAEKILKAFRCYPGFVID